MKLLPWIMAIMWLGARYTARQFMSVENAVSFGVLSNILLIVILIFLVVYYKYKTLAGERPSFFEDFKDCMKVAMKYVIGATAAIFIYYGFLTNDVQTIRDARITNFNESINTDAGLSNLKTENPQLKNSTREQLIQTNKENVERFVSTNVQVLMGLFALVVVSLIYSLLAVFFWRSIVKRI